MTPTVACSRCGRDTPISDRRTFVGPSGLISRYCPSCLAKLRAERKAREREAQLHDPWAAV